MGGTLDFIGKTMLNLGEIPAQNIEIFPHSEEGSDMAGQMIAGCKITEVFCDKLFADNPNWSLVWKAVLPLDSASLALCHKYYKKSCFITLVQSQEELFETDDKKPIILNDAEVECTKKMNCETCNENAVYLDANQQSWCGNHVGAAIGVQVRKIVYPVPA